MNAVAFHRVASWCLRHHVPLVPKIMQGLSFVLCSCVLPPSATVGPGTVLGYRGLGTVVHARAVIGEGCLIGPNVTIGGRSGHHDVPVIGDRVFVGAGARILGPVRIGSGAVVGANAVVVDDVEPSTLVAGVPARLVRRDVNVDDFVTMPER